MFKKIYLVLILLVIFLSNGCVSNSPEINSIIKEVKRDTDQDGVSNDKDKCPNTTEGMEVNEEGCP